MKNIKIGTETLYNVGVLKAADADTNGVFDLFVDTSDGTATAADIGTGYCAYVNGVKLVGTGGVLNPEAFYLKLNTKKYGG